MTTRHVLLGAVHVLSLRIMHLYVNTINANMNLQWSGGTDGQNSQKITSLQIVIISCTRT